MTGMAIERPVFVSTLPAERGQTQLAWAVVLVSALVFLALAPFATVQLGPTWVFIPIYQSALIVNDLITAVLLFGQHAILRSRAVLVLAGGYLFTACMAALHALTFPGLFAPGGLLGAGPQSTAWMYIFWHTGFPLVVIAYDEKTVNFRQICAIDRRPIPILPMSGRLNFGESSPASRLLLPPIWPMIPRNSSGFIPRPSSVHVNVLNLGQPVEMRTLGASASNALLMSSLSAPAGER